MSYGVTYIRNLKKKRERERERRLHLNLRLKLIERKSE